MGIIYSSLKRKTEEEQSHFDRRISQMLPVMAGYCYFDIRNYDTFSGEYNLYIDWDMELMEYLAYPLPSGGYFVKVTSEQADDFNELGEGVPVYMKLIGKMDRFIPTEPILCTEEDPTVSSSAVQSLSHLKKNTEVHDRW